MAEASMGVSVDDLFSRLYDEYADLARRVAGKFVPPNDVDDIAQEFWFNCYKAMEGGMIPRSMKRVVFSGIRNQAVSYSRRSQPHFHLGEPEYEAGQQAAVRETLAEMHPKKASVLYLHYGDGMSYRQIAQAQGTYKGRVKDEVGSAAREFRVLFA